MMCDFEVYSCVVSTTYIKCGPPKRTLKSHTEILKKLQDLQNVIMTGTYIHDNYQYLHMSIKTL